MIGSDEKGCWWLEYACIIASGSSFGVRDRVFLVRRLDHEGLALGSG